MLSWLSNRFTAKGSLMQTGKANLKPIVFLLLSICGVIFLGFHSWKAPKQHHDLTVKLLPQSKRLQNPVNDVTAQQVVSHKVDISTWHNVVVSSGDSLAAIFKREKLSYSDLQQVMASAESLRKIHPHEVIRLQANNQHELRALQYFTSATQHVTLTREGNQFVKKTSNLPITTKISCRTTTVRQSLYHDAKQSGFTNRMLAQLQQLFGGKINFSRDIQEGDRFNILYRNFFVNGKKVRNGHIVAAELMHRGKIYQVIHYTYPVNHSGYYTPDGKGIETRFLNSPLHYKRISSGFSYHRLDPILHKVRPHLGVDYAAKVGTPIHSIGDGRIVFIGRNGGYGKAIKIRYGRHYVALYGHMWHFAHLKLSQRVHKGQIIGYVGKTGWATGPHLHFGFYVDGIPRNWLIYKKPTIKAIPSRYKKGFLATTKRLFQQLHIHQTTELATNNSANGKDEDR